MKNFAKDKFYSGGNPPSTKKKRKYDAHLFRRAILLQCDAARPASLSFIVMAAGLERAGFSFKDSELRSEVDYLEQKGYVEISSSAISSAHLRIRLSALGIDYLESEGF